MLLAKQTVGKVGLLCQQPCPADLPTAWTDAVGKPSCRQSCRSLCQPDFANSRRFPIGEGNGNQADGAPPSPTVHVAVGEAFPTGPAFLLAKSSFPSLKTPTVPTGTQKPCWESLRQQDWSLHQQLSAVGEARVSCSDTATYGFSVVATALACV
jgi:hypothetical protein